MGMDAMDWIAKLQKAHDYFGKAKAMVGHISKVKRAAEIEPRDTEGLRALVGLKDKDVKKLLDTMDKRAKAVEETAKATYPPVPCDTLEPWSCWCMAIDEYGKDSKEADAARSRYFKALVAYEVELRSRMQYCDIVIKTSKEQIEAYDGSYERWAEAETLLEALIETPDARDTAHHTEALAMHLEFQGVGERARRIARGHRAIIDVAKRHKAEVARLRAENDAWISDVGRTVLSSMLTKALKSFGVAV